MRSGSGARGEDNSVPIGSSAMVVVIRCSELQTQGEWSPGLHWCQGARKDHMIGKGLLLDSSRCGERSRAGEGNGRE